MTIGNLFRFANGQPIGTHWHPWAIGTHWHLLAPSCFGLVATQHSDDKPKRSDEYFFPTNLIFNEPESGLECKKPPKSLKNNLENSRFGKINFGENRFCKKHF